MESVTRRLHIGKHTSFHAEVTIHELTNVPLVTGTFTCKWRFKNHISPQSAANGGDSSSSLLHPRSALHISRRAKDDSDSSDDDSSQGTSSRRASVSSRNSGRSSPNREVLGVPNRTLSSMTVRPGQANAGAKAEAHGVTQGVPLSKHIANWEDKHVFCPVSASVGKDGELGYCPLKFVIRQAFHNEQGKVEEARLGEVHADLAEFVDAKRSATRRYLLENSKINALLRITVKMTYVSGVRDYHAPPRDRNKSQAKDAKDFFKRKNVSSDSVNSKKNSKSSNKDKTSPTSSVHSKRSDGSRRANGHLSQDASLASLGFSAMGSPPNHRHHNPHHAPEALIEHFFTMSLQDGPAASASPRTKTQHLLPDEPSPPQSLRSRTSKQRLDSVASSRSGSSKQSSDRKSSNSSGGGVSRPMEPPVTPRAPVSS